MNQKFIQKAQENSKFVVIGTSAGGVEALGKIIPAFLTPSTLAAFIVIHLPAEGPNLIPDLFQESTRFRLKEAEPGEPIEAETIYVAPPDYHLNVESNHTVSLSTEEPVQFSRPSIDLLFESAALAFGCKTLGILLTGANGDGSQGLKTIQERGGLTIIQDPKDADYKAMPEAGLKHLTPDAVMTLTEIITFLKELSGATHG